MPYRTYYRHRDRDRCTGVDVCTVGPLLSVQGTGGNGCGCGGGLGGILCRTRRTQQLHAPSVDSGLTRHQVTYIMQIGILPTCWHMIVTPVSVLMAIVLYHYREEVLSDTRRVQCVAPMSHLRGSQDPRAPLTIARLPLRPRSWPPRRRWSLGARPGRCVALRSKQRASLPCVEAHLLRPYSTAQRISRYSEAGRSALGADRPRVAYLWVDHRFIVPSSPHACQGRR